MMIGLKNENSIIFPRVNMAANYAEIGRISKLETDFQKVSLVYSF